MAPAWSRRALLLGGASAWLASTAARALAQPLQPDADGDRVGARLTPWRPGALDIHHIATGRGDAALVIGPAGQTLLIDAGATASPLSDSIPPAPDGSRRPGEWIARYALRHIAPTGKSAIDAALVTHLHPDHLGDVTDSTPLAPGGGYRLTGIADVDAHLPIECIIDRGYPSYDWPAPIAAPFAANYVAFIRAREKAGKRVERFRVGAADQLAQPGPSGFEIRNIAANGEVWTGTGNDARLLVPPLSGLAPGDIPDENMLSAAIRIRLGAFSYFAAGDLTANTFDGALPWRDIGTAAAQACGPVDVATAPHHGMFDGVSGDMVRALAPRAWIIQAWHASHPSLSTLERLLSERLYPGPRDIFATGLTSASALVNRRLVDRFAVRSGHIVVRVSAGGRGYRIVTTDNADEQDRVTAVFQESTR